ncbi:MAG: PAS domain S-box protein, partial [Anaerolineales bacterium]|nr:PAS domain S-box protein [Anaerolineales bacterium]
MAHLDSFRQANLDLTNGFIQLSLARTENTPFDRRQGLVLLEQATASFERQVAQLRQSEAITAEFQRELAHFHDVVQAFEAGAPDSQGWVALWVAFDRLEHQAESLDAQTRASLRAEEENLTRVFRLTITLAAVLFGGVGFNVYRAERGRSLSEQNLNFLNALTLTTSMAANANEAFQASVRLICEAQGWEYGEVWISHQGVLTIGAPHYIHPDAHDRLQAFWETTPAYDFSPGSGIPGRTWRSQASAWTFDVQRLKQAEFLRLEHAREAGLRGVVTIPIVDNTEVLAVMLFMSLRPLPADDRLLRLLSTALQQIAPVIRRQQITDALLVSKEKYRHFSEELEDRVRLRTMELEQEKTRTEAILLRLRESEVRYRALFEQSTDGVFILDLEGTHRFVNQHAADMLGYAPAELSGLSFREVIHPADHPKSENVLARLLAGELVPIYERRVRRKDGSSFPVEISAELVWDENGRPLHIQSLMRDITERKQAELALRQSEAKYREAANNLETVNQRLQLATEAGGIGIWEWDIQHDCLILDDQMYALYGTRPGKAPGSMAELRQGTLIHRGDLPRLEEELAQFLDAGALFDAGYRVVLEDGRIRHIRARAVMFRDENGQPQRAVGVNWDVTDEKAAAESLRRALEQEKELGELKSRFVSMASHEFRTPLAAISATTETLLAYRDRLNAAQLDARLHKILYQIEHMKGIMEDFLQLARIQAGRLELKLEAGDLAHLCTEIVEEFRAHAAYRERIALQSTPASIPYTFDVRVMRHVINNLIANALKYSAADALIHVCLCADGAAITLAVADQGIGIPTADLKHLFEPFHRGSNVGTTSGTGLGLTITKEGVELHDGTIDVDSELGVGTTFTVTLPVCEP